VRIRVLGCHGSDQLLGDSGRSRSCGTCGFLINDTVLLDAGTVGEKLRLEEQQAIHHVLLSHAHFDHIKGLPTLADNRFGTGDRALVVAGIPDVLTGLRTHVFNDSLYPDFFRLPSSEQPTLSPLALSPGQSCELSGLHVIPIRVNHLVPAVGFLISDGRSTIVYSGDTHCTDDIWRAARDMPDLRAVFIEASYPNRMADLAERAKHLTPAMVQGEFRKLGRPEVPLFVFHMKPRFRDEIVQELYALQIPKLTALEEGQVLTVGAS
jgi:ribonuclease BN (tRNA processing enzyme)